MKLIKNKNIKKILIPLLIAGILLVSYFSFAYFLKTWPFQSAIDPNSLRQDTTSESYKNDNPIKKSDSQAGINEGKDSSEVPISNTFSVNITRLEQVNNDVIFSAIINGSNNTGTCVITFSNPNDRPIVKELSSTTKDGTSICEATFSALEFSYLGEWNASLRYYNGTEQATVEGKVTIK